MSKVKKFVSELGFNLQLVCSQNNDLARENNGWSFYILENNRAAATLVWRKKDTPNDPPSLLVNYSPGYDEPFKPSVFPEMQKQIQEVVRNPGILLYVRSPSPKS